jgi:DNA repair protein RecO (recombination protein O)
METRLTGIILGKRDVGEADRLYTFYTLEKGKIQAVAKGVRKSAARLAASLENFNLVSLTLVGKGGTKKITHAIIEENFSCIRNNLESLEQVFSTVKILDKLVEKGEKDVELYKYLVDFLRSVNSLGVNSGFKLEIIRLGYILKMLDQLGYRFEVNKCVNCRKNLQSGNNFFNISSGGVFCGDCGKISYSAIKISDNSIKAMRIIYQNQIGSLKKLQTDRRGVNELKAVIEGYLRWIAK